MQIAGSLEYFRLFAYRMRLWDFAMRPVCLKESESHGLDMGKLTVACSRGRILLGGLFARSQLWAAVSTQMTRESVGGR